MSAIEVEISDAGEIRPVDPTIKLPSGRAYLTWSEDDPLYPARMSTEAFRDWFSPEEDEAWAYLQQER